MSAKADAPAAPARPSSGVGGAREALAGRRLAPPPPDLPRGHGTFVPGYLLRPAPPDPQFAPALEWILIGAAVQDNFALCRAWDIASGMGLDKQRQRFHIRQMLALLPDGSVTPSTAEWTLDRGALLVAHGPPRAADDPQPTSPAYALLTGREAAKCRCRILFRAPLRIIFRGKLAQQPTWTDLVAGACRRVRAFLPVAMEAAWREIEREVLETSRGCRASPFEGARLDLHRYSARQQAELDLQGVHGSIALPEGPGTLWPLLAAAQWLHLGKGTVMGLGQPELHWL